MTEIISVAVALVVGGIMGYVLKAYGLSGTITAIQTDVNTVKTDVSQLQAKVNPTVSAPVVTAHLA